MDDNKNDYSNSKECRMNAIATAAVFMTLSLFLLKPVVERQDRQVNNFAELWETHEVRSFIESFTNYEKEHCGEADFIWRKQVIWNDETGHSYAADCSYSFRRWGLPILFVGDTGSTAKCP